MSEEKISGEIKVIDVDMDSVVEDSTYEGHYRIRFKLSNQPPDEHWIGFFNKFYQDNPNYWKGTARVENDSIIVKIADHVNMQSLLDIVVKESVKNANRKYQELQAKRKREEKNAEIQHQQKNEKLQEFKKKLDNLKF